MTRAIAENSTKLFKKCIFQAYQDMSQIIFSEIVWFNGDGRAAVHHADNDVAANLFLIENALCHYEAGDLACFPNF